MSKLLAVMALLVETPLLLKSPGGMKMPWAMVGKPVKKSSDGFICRA